MIRSLEGEAGKGSAVVEGSSLAGVEKLWGCHHIALGQSKSLFSCLRNEGLEVICPCSNFLGMCEAPGLSWAVPDG